MSLSRRTILRSAATAAGGLAAASLFGSASTALGAMAAMPRRRSRLEKLQILQIGVGGSIAPYDRQQLESHPDVVFTGLCDVDANALANAAKDRPQAFTCKDYREAFDAHADKFDAVIVCTPDHNHALPMILALQNGKHCYGQKPLVQQLSEVAAIEAAAAANPRLVTQVGNQRMGKTGRQYAVEILEKDLLGKPV
ncbi:MAG: Glucose--fructose oxidoreductase precursor, partial [Planctomycetota bacterium]